MRESLKYLMDKFPHFLDKREGSNFHDTIDVFNTDFKKLRQLLYEVDHSWNIMCPVLIKRVQVEDFVADYSFLNYLEHPKRATIYKGKDVIFTKYYPYESKSKVDTIIHTLTDTSESKLNTTIYKIVVETHDEYNYTITTETRNPKLDYIGKFIKCPRRTYQKVDEEDYPYTVPTYVSGGSEDDYNYIERMKQYLQWRWKKPLPELYLWQKYNITEKINSKHGQLFRIASATFDNDYCGIIGDYDLSNGYIFATFNTTHPLLDQNLIISSYFLNDKGEQITRGKHGVFIKTENDTNYLYKGDTPFTTKITNESSKYFDIKIGYLGEDTLLIDAPLPDNYLTSDNESIVLGVIPTEEEEEKPDNPLIGNVVFVSPAGDDKNDGRSRSKPLKTIQHAIDIVSEDEIIVLLAGNYFMSGPLIINKSCTIIGEAMTPSYIDVNISNTAGDEWIYINPSDTEEVKLTLYKVALSTPSKVWDFYSYAYYINKGTTKMIISGADYKNDRK